MAFHGNNDEQHCHDQNHQGQNQLRTQKQHCHQTCCGIAIRLCSRLSNINLLLERSNIWAAGTWALGHDLGQAKGSRDLRRSLLGQPGRPPPTARHIKLYGEPPWPCSAHVFFPERTAAAGIPFLCDRSPLGPVATVGKSPQVQSPA